MQLNTLFILLQWCGFTKEEHNFHLAIAKSSLMLSQCACNIFLFIVTFQFSHHKTEIYHLLNFCRLCLRGMFSKIKQTFICSHDNSNSTRNHVSVPTLLDTAEGLLVNLAIYLMPCISVNSIPVALTLQIN